MDYIKGAGGSTVERACRAFSNKCPKQLAENITRKYILGSLQELKDMGLQP